MAIFIKILLIVGVYSSWVMKSVREIQWQVWKKLSSSFTLHFVAIWLVQGVTNCWPHCCRPVPKHGQWITDLLVVCVWLQGQTICLRKKPNLISSWYTGSMLCAAGSLFGENSPKQVNTLSRSYNCISVIVQGTCHVLYVQTFNISVIFKILKGMVKKGGGG